MSDVVYFIRNPHTNNIKIGYCAESRLFDRRDELQTGAGCELVLLCWTFGGREKEATLHERFAHLRTHGEWFKPDNELKSFIFDIMAKSWSEKQTELLEQRLGMSVHEYHEKHPPAPYESTNSN